MNPVADPRSTAWNLTMTPSKKSPERAPDLLKPGRSHGKFDQEVADSRDHDKQSGKDDARKRPPGTKKNKQ
jgi:hypothetical protein